ncbi:flavodoxin family protein [Metapseudomonas lalkuanensis]|uniref:Flavodoxin family protein n=1 Tax=Metapseudomonas lalkuanensis TaxID=2604832 RepID=A0A5J6QLW8_9GAMM|nr:flavodoxin family protein [Pseudomonas lalkuanensis]QEY63524.1 flavodoxin family protein [Pseudomonas lalkuanensis]
MRKLAVIYHSAFGHTEHIARQICEGAQDVANMEVHLLKAEDLAGEPGQLLAFDGFILGSPTYFGGVSGVFKSFMDATGPLWRSQQLNGRLAAGFTVSSLAAGDKQSTLMALFVFCMQHGMLWVGNPILPEQHAGVPIEDAANRLGSWSGLMAQSSHSAPADPFAPGDVKTARMFGRNFSETLHQLAVPATEVPA